MSQWVPNSEGLTQSQEERLNTGPEIKLDPVSVISEGGPRDPLQEPGRPAEAPWWARIAPFFLSSFFFLSAFFVIFAPLPLLFFHIQKGRRWTAIAALSNGVIVDLVGGHISAIFYFVFVASLSLVLSELLQWKKSLEKCVVGTLLAMGAMALLAGSLYAAFHHINLIHELRAQVASFVDYLVQSITTNSSTTINPGETDEWKQSLFLEFPSAIAVFSLILVWSNLVLLLKINPGKVRDKIGLDTQYLKKWKAPEFLIWPTILAGFFLIVDFGLVSHIALNVFKFLMAIYAIQGLSILGFFFDKWKIRGFLRFLGFSVTLFLMMPLVLSLGFFDLWFDFRGKFRQS